MKIGIVGSGYVGATIAYAVLLKNAASKIVLVDINKKRAEAEAADISHAAPFSNPVDVIAGEYSDLTNSEVVVITAGVNQKPGETRLQLLERNADVFKNVVPNILEHAPSAILLVATNPVDVMTHLTAEFVKEYGIEHPNVIGSGTTLDTARFRTLLASYLDVAPQNVHGYVVGEHGDSEVLTWSIVDIGGMPLDDFIHFRGLKFGSEQKSQIDYQVRKAAYSIIEGKGATYYGIGAAVANIIDVIVHKQKAILTICSPQEEIAGVKNVTASLPHLIGGGKILSPLAIKLNYGEQLSLRRSVEVIKEFIQ